MSDHNPNRRLTYEDYILIPDDLRRHEIIDGVHHISLTPWVLHQDVLLHLLVDLANFIEKHDLGEIYHAPVDVLLSPHDIVMPDILFISKERLNILTEANVQGTPDLLIEITWDDTRERDEGIKLQRYGLFGVREYWVVDPQREATRVYRLTESGLQLASSLSKEDTLSSPLLPGLTLSVAEVIKDRLFSEE